jgi:hypothetical protein
LPGVSDWDISLLKRWYIADLRSGLGGGNGGSLNVPGVPYIYNSKIGTFFVNNNNIHIKVGGNGDPGGYSTNPGAGGGGGGAGEHSSCCNVYCLPVNGGTGGIGNGGSPVSRSSYEVNLNQNIINYSLTFYYGGRGGESLNGVSGGPPGMSGRNQPNGSPGGYCNIYKF